MSEHYRALIVILVLASIVFAFAKAPATATAMTVEDFKRRRNCWYFVTLAGFLSPNFWIFVLIVSIFLFYAARREHNVVALFFFLFLALPQISVEIPGFAGIRYITKIDYLRILILFVLLPACFAVRKATVKQSSRSRIPDILLGAYIVLNVALRGQNEPFTGILRLIINAFIDFVIPYYAVSRYLTNLKIFRESLMCFAIAALIASAVGAFEFFKEWLVYTSLDGSLGVDVPSIYLRRGDHLRAIATSGHAIVLGYVLAAAIGIFLYLKKNVPQNSHWILGLALLIAGEISPLSKGPWVGVVVVLMVFLALSPNRLSIATKVLFAAPPIVLFLLATEAGRKIIDFLPFVGQLDTGSAEYRQLLFDESIKIILDNPILGSTDFMLHLEELRQGQGIIDLVNTYLIVALNTGLVGLALFTSFFSKICIGIIHGIRRLRHESELFILGQSLLATLSGLLVIIASCSPIFHVPLLLMTIAGMGNAYWVIVSNLKKNDAALRTGVDTERKATSGQPFTQAPPQDQGSRNSATSQ